MGAFLTEMQPAFKHLRVTQDIHGDQLAEIVESTCRYVDELAHHRASIDRQEVILARLCKKFMPDKDNSGSGRANFGHPTASGKHIDRMTRNVQETVELMQRPIMRAKAKRMEEEYKGEVALFEKMLQDLAWHVLEEQREDFGGSKSFLFSRVQMEETKKESLEGLEASKPKGEPFLDPTASSRFYPTIAGRLRVTKGV
ncbi:hypothetical protein M9H77_18873 [Catharanthus roseus]|uniref:Uncharacterized protein n=1 Tax=Catharanthus roseus TaxID=4058 RepID=A0ACC0B8N0_CATRO|nr:hypothetical protein M9H77_18873 [Catharanthus roseus]